MDSEEDTFYDDFDHPMDSGRESNEDESEKLEAAEYPFEVLSTEEIVQHMADTIKEVNTIIQMPATTTRILLNHFKWDKDKLMERFYDVDQEKLFDEARVINPFRKGPAISSFENSTATSSSMDETEECEICFMTLSTDSMSGLECGHRFCTLCWDEYLQTKIMEQGEGQTIACPANDCDILVDDASVMHLVQNSKVKLKYQHLITNSFVVCNRLLRWCRTPDCNSAIKVQYVDAKPVTCKCNDTFCFHCGEDWHDPIRCELMRKWIKKCIGESTTSHWIAVNTKDCIKCGLTIEKNGGCNRMTCPNESCGAFCWACLKSWDVHGYNGYCNKYDEENRKTITENSRAALEKDLLYCERYANHKQSLKLENRLYESIKVKMEEMQQHNMSWIEVQFLKTAVDILRSCRQTLTYAYVFTYYLKKNNQSIIFDDNQSDLEGATETLSKYLERDIADADVRDIKQTVTDKYQYCESRRKVLSKHVQEGYEKELWEFIDEIVPN